MKPYKEKFKTSPQSMCGINFTIWVMATKGFWDTKHLVVLLKSIHKTILTPQNRNSSRPRGTRNCISDGGANYSSTEAFLFSLPAKLNLHIFRVVRVMENSWKMNI